MAKKKIGFEFPLDNSQQWDGFNDPGIEHFSGNPFEYLGREVTQNTLDAISDPPGRINVRYIEVPTDSIPDVGGLSAAISACQVAAVDESSKAFSFFEDARSALEKRKVGVLQIEDFNTTGVIGPCENGQPYFALMKATGQSKKSSDAAAGSFGIGKFAPYTASSLRTVFITTVFEDEDGQYQHYCQGKSILMSHVVDAKTHRGTGYWGVRDKCLPLVGEVEILPDWLRRGATGHLGKADAGTRLSILGFPARKGWQYLLAANVIGNFFGAIVKGRLEVTIEDGPTINASTLSSLFHDAEILASLAEQKGEPEKIESRRAYLQALTSVERKVEHTQNEKLGNCELNILVAEGLPKKVAFLRTGMLITDELAKLKRFGDFKEFAAVLECHSEKGNALLRAMEPPRHDDFEPERLPSEKEKRAARIALREIGAWVRQMLARHAKDPVSEVTSLDELAEFFGDPDGEAGKKGFEENPAGNFNVRARPLKRPQPAMTSSDAELGEDDFGMTGDDTGPKQAEPKPPAEPVAGNGGEASPPQDPPTGAGVKGGAIPTSAPIASLGNLRAIPLGPTRRRVAFTANADGVMDVEFQDSGADSNRSLEAVSTSLGIVAGGKVCGLPVKAGERVSVDVEFADVFAGTLRAVGRAV